jgi:hypothetical protein
MMRLFRIPIAVRFVLSSYNGVAWTDSAVCQTTTLLLERLRAWKHMCGYLEDYFAATAKVQKSQSKDYEKILKVSASSMGREDRG